MNELKPCPFCGNNNIEMKKYFDNGLKWFVTCRECGTEKAHPFKGISIREWNTRPTEVALNAEVEK